MHRLPIELIQHLQNQNSSHIAHITNMDNTTFLHQAWKTTPQLSIPPLWVQYWEDFTQALTEAHIQITDGDDEIIWALSKFGTYSPKDGYLALTGARKRHIISDWWRHLWKLKAPPRTQMLMWTILKNKIPTGDNLLK